MLAEAEPPTATKVTRAVPASAEARSRDGLCQMPSFACRWETRPKVFITAAFLKWNIPGINIDAIFELVSVVFVLAGHKSGVTWVYHYDIRTSAGSAMPLPHTHRSCKDQYEPQICRNDYARRMNGRVIST